MKGLVSSLREEIAYVNNSKKIACSLDIRGIKRKFEPQTELMIFRIAQEAIQNIIKHADAANIEVTMRYEPGNFMMCVSDDGKGFNATQEQYSKSLGMLSMQNRAKAVEGTLEVSSTHGKGTIVSLQISKSQ